MKRNPTEYQVLKAELETSLRELEEAEKLINKINSERAYIGLAGNLMIEVPKHEAIEYIRRRKETIMLLLRKIDSETKAANNSENP